MKVEGAQFRYFLDNEVSTYDEILKKYSADLTVKVDGFDIHYTSPAKVHGGVISSNLPDEVQGKCWFPVTETGDIEKELKAQQEDYWHKTFDEVVEAYNKEVEKIEALEKETTWEQVLNDYYNDAQINFLDREYEKMTCEGKKESANKLEFELDWTFIEQMAERMATNKEKYNPYNWQLPMDVEKLKQSLLRHTLEIMKGNDADEDRTMGHYESVALNAMMICYQLKNNL